MIGRMLAALVIALGFVLGVLTAAPSQAAQNVTLNILPPTGTWGVNANLTSGYGHCCVTVSDATGADWSNSGSAHPTYLRAIGVSSDINTRKRAIYRVVDGPSYIGCNFTTWIDIYSAETGAWLFSIGHLHTVNGIYRTGGLNFKNTGSSTDQTAIQVATTTLQQDSCTNDGHHVHETSPWGTMAGSIVLNSKFDVGEEGAYLNSDVANFTRKLTWEISPNPGQNHRLIVWHSGKCMRPQSDSAGARIYQTDCTSSTYQQVGIIDTLNGYFDVVFLRSGLCMEVLNWATYGNAPIGISNCDGTTKQQWSGPFNWSFYPHYNRFVSEYYGGPYNGPAWLALEGESLANGAFLNQWWWADRPNQYYIHY